MVHREQERDTRMDVFAKYAQNIFLYTRRPMKTTTNAETCVTKAMQYARHASTMASQRHTMKRSYAAPATNY